jgi:hypothetical protein
LSFIPTSCFRIAIPGGKSLKSPIVELWASVNPDDSRGAEKRVELDSIPGDYIVDVGYMSNIRYTS